MRWVAAGEFPAPFRIGRRILRWDAAEIDAWIETQRLDCNTEET
jgi:predicted DNA-binding transcriptional regulator AlpA